MAQSLDIDATTIIIAGRALEQFKKEYPNRIAVWVKSEPKQLDIKISSIHDQDNSEASWKEHIYFHRTRSIMDL